jgi:hypothetical protein
MQHAPDDQGPQAQGSSPVSEQSLITPEDQALYRRWVAIPVLVFLGLAAVALVAGPVPSPASGPASSSLAPARQAKARKPMKRHPGKKAAKAKGKAKRVAKGKAQGAQGRPKNLR